MVFIALTFKKYQFMKYYLQKSPKNYNISFNVALYLYYYQYCL